MASGSTFAIAALAAAWLLPGAALAQQADEIRIGSGSYDNPPGAAGLDPLAQLPIAHCEEDVSC